VVDDDGINFTFHVPVPFEILNKFCSTFVVTGPTTFVKFDVLNLASTVSGSLFPINSFQSIVRYSGEFCMDDGTVLDALQYIKLAIEKVQRHR
jgi:hypothetical protein